MQLDSLVQQRCCQHIFHGLRNAELLSPARSCVGREAVSRAEVGNSLRAQQ